jgi:peptidoglycan biosynthesis protein MviN/MurJ (putative lipid II flippase)
MVQGSVSILDYAKKFTELPVNVTVGVVTTVLTPAIAFLYIKNDIIKMVDETQRYFRMVSLILLPLVVMFIIVPKEIVTLVLLRGAFKVEQVELTSEVLRWFGIGVFYTCIYVIYSQILIAQKKIKLFSIIVIGTYLLKITFNVLFYETYKLVTFPVSWVLTQLIVSSLILYFGVVEFRKRIITEVIKIHLVLIFMIIINYIFYSFILFYFKDTVGIVLLIILMIFSVFFSEITLIYLFKIEERDIITKYLISNERKNKNN